MLLEQTPRMLYTMAAYIRWKMVKQNPTPYNR